MKLRPIILCGGTGSRLWPLSRDEHPKQILSLFGGRTLLQETVLRMEGAPDVAAPLVVSNAQYRFLIAEQMREIDKLPCPLLLEPAGRNTAPALTIAALRVLSEGDDALLLAMPADHAINDRAAFQDAIKKAMAQAIEGRLVTFGVVPDRPETGYGYIRRGVGDTIVEFVEKPDALRAARYLAAGDYLWNSGLFLMRATVWIEELKRYRPDILAACERALAEGREDRDFVYMGQCFNDCPSESIDYAVMEKTRLGAVIPLVTAWSDVGAFGTLWDLGDKDEAGNVVRGDEDFMVTENQSTYIPIGVRHRLENPGVIPLEMIEVQSGSYLGEDDIMRFEDRYDRIDSSLG